MSAPKPRNERPTSGPGKVSVGERRRGGQVSAWIEQVGPGHRRIGLNAAFMTGLSVEIDLADAAALRDGLTALLEEAGYE